MVGPSKLWEATSRETRSAKAGQNLARLAGKHHETLEYEYIKAIRKPWWVFTTVLQSPKKSTTAPPQILLDLSISILDVSTMCPQCVHRRDHLRPLLYSWAAMTWSILRIAHCLDASAQLVHDASEPSNPSNSVNIKLCQVEDKLLSLYSCSQGNTGRSLQLPGFHDTSVI